MRLQRPTDDDLFEDELRSFDPLHAVQERAEEWAPEVTALRDSLSEEDVGGVTAVAERWVIHAIVQAVAETTPDVDRTKRERESDDFALLVRQVCLVSTHRITWNLAGRVGERQGCLRKLLDAVAAARTDTKKWESLASALVMLEGGKFLDPVAVRKSVVGAPKNKKIYPLVAALLERVRGKFPPPPG